LHFQAFGTPLSGRCRSLSSLIRQYEGFKAFDKYIGEAEWAALIGHSSDARSRALQLIEHCPTGGCGPEEHSSHCVPTNRDPSTDVWKLLDSLRLNY
jgi:hypothetical protein